MHYIITLSDDKCYNKVSWPWTYIKCKKKTLVLKWDKCILNVMSIVGK